MDPHHYYSAEYNYYSSYSQQQKQQQQQPQQPQQQKKFKTQAGAITANTLATLQQQGSHFYSQYPPPKHETNVYSQYPPPKPQEHISQNLSSQHVSPSTLSSIPTIHPPQTTKQGKKHSIPSEGPLRSAGDKIWNDPTLNEWDEKDFRIFIGNLGNDVNDAILLNHFRQYQSVSKAKIIRNTNYNQKSKGYGFVSFSDPHDFIRALKEMNGKYIGSRPCIIRKSTWKDRLFDEKKKTKSRGVAKTTKTKNPAPHR